MMLHHLQRRPLQATLVGLPAGSAKFWSAPQPAIPGLVHNAVPGSAATGVRPAWRHVTVQLPSCTGSTATAARGWGRSIHGTAEPNCHTEPTKHFAELSTHMPFWMAWL